MNNGNLPAMPLPEGEYDQNYKHGAWDGLTKREYFAAMAMQGLMATIMDNDCSIAELACDAVSASDALLAELEKGE